MVFYEKVDKDTGLGLRTESSRPDAADCCINRAIARLTRMVFYEKVDKDIGLGRHTESSRPHEIHSAQNGEIVKFILAVYL